MNSKPPATERVISRKPLAITCGDPAGIGPEIISQWAAEASGEVLADCVLIGPKSWLESTEVFKYSLYADQKTAIGSPEFQAAPGAPCIAAAQLAWDAMKEAAQGCREGRYRAVVTGPVSKYWLQQAGYPHPGQTEFFAASWGGIPTMGFVGERLRVVLATWHVPLMDLRTALTRETVARAVNRAANLARAYGLPSASIGVCGLNPHAGEEGLLGLEEREWIDPLLVEMRQSLPGLSACQPADTIFHRALRGEFDVVVALYHDQGLGPLKTIEFDSAVNVTLGLPFVRTSPDHGTAFDIAGKGLASSKSLANAVAVARTLSGMQKE